MILHNTYRIGLLVALLGLIIAISGCNRKPSEDDDDEADVGVPGNNVLQEQGSLHVFHFRAFYIDDDNINYDIMYLDFDNFRPSSSNIEPEEDEDQTLNNLDYTQTAWDEDYVTWVDIRYPLLDSRFTQKRQYRVLDEETLSAPKERLNRPTYETIDDNIYERQLAASFVWDFGSYTHETIDGSETVRSEFDISGDQIRNREELDGFDFLPHAMAWATPASISVQYPRFSNGAKVFGASRSVHKQTLVVEAVFDDGEFTLTPTRFAQGETNLTDALVLYPHGGNRLEYRFTIDYQYHHRFYMTFDTALQTVRLYSTASSAQLFEADYIEHSDPDYIEVDTASLDIGDRALLNMPAYFNPIITGPHTVDGSESVDPNEKAFYYGKRFIKTDDNNRGKLEPVLFMNQTAKRDIEKTFKDWREQEYLDRR